MVSLLAQVFLSNNIVSRKEINHAIQMEERGEKSEDINFENRTFANTSSLPISLADLKQVTMSDVIEYMMHIQKYGSLDRLPDEIL